MCAIASHRSAFLSIPNSLLKDHRLKSAHCHATINSTNQTINEYWKRKRLLHKNPLLNYFSTEQSEEKMCSIYKKFRDLHDKAWRKYEAGEKCDRDRTLPTLWVHRFTTVASCFGYIINLTNVSIQNDPRWLEKFVMLDALTEVTVKRSCRPPPKEHQGPYSVWFSNEYDYNRHMTALGSRWILLFALSPPPLVSGLAQAIRERMTQLARQSIEPESFKKVFCVLRDLISIDVDDRRVVRATCQLYKSIIRRKEHHLQPSYLKDAHGVEMAKSVIQKDSIMLPFLSDIMDNGVHVREESLLPAKLLRAQANFYHHFTVLTCKELFSQIADVSHDHVFPVLRNVYYVVHADYLHSNRAKYYRRELIQYIQVMVCVIEEAMEKAQKDKKKVMDALFKISRVEPSWRKIQR